MILESVRPLLDNLVKRYKIILSDNLVGVYIHGSIAMNCFNPATSDVDVLIVVQDTLTLEKRQELGKITLEINKQAPKKGLELSVVTMHTLQHFSHPTPHEFHFSNYWLKRFEDNSVDLAGEHFDPDLAAHFTITKARGLTLYGPPAADIFPDIAAEYYRDAIVTDTKESLEQIKAGPTSGSCIVPIYGVLNAPRVLAYLKEDAITSKTEGGQWGLKNMPKEYHQLIQSALNDYTNITSNSTVEAGVLQRYAMSVEKLLV